MDLAPYTDRLTPYLAAFTPLIGDARTQRLFDAVVEGLLITGTPICSRIAANSPACAHAPEGQRGRRFINGQTTKRSQLAAPPLTAALRERTLTHLQAAPPEEVWLIVDGLDLRKPPAHTLQYLDRVPALTGGTVPGYHTLEVLAVVPGYRGLLYQHVFSTHEPGFRSMSQEVHTALTTVSVAVAAALPATRVVWIRDAGFADIAVWRTLWQAGQPVVSRTYHADRLLRYRQDGRGLAGNLAAAAGAARRRVSLETEMEVRLRGQRTAKRQRVTGASAVWQMAVPDDPSSRTEAPSGTVCWQRAAAVVGRSRDCEWAPWVLVTDLPVGSAAAVRRVFMMDRQRWGVADAFKFTKTAVGWEAVQLLMLEGVRRMVALAGVAAGFRYELGVELADADVQILARLGGGAGRAERPPGKQVIARGLARVLDMLVTAALLEYYRNETGDLPPPLEALLNRYGQFVGFSAEL